MSQVSVRFVQFDSQRARLIEAGRGPTVVILASMVVLAPAYRPVLRKLAARFHTVVIELPGAGRGSKLQAPWDVEHYARWTSGLLRHLKFNDVILVGHSNSGPVALTVVAASEAPRELVRQLVLVDTIGFDDRFSLMRIIAARAWDALLEPGLTLRACWQPPFNLLVHTRNFLNQVRSAARADLRAAARQLKTPLWIAWGKRDHTMPVRCAHLLKEHAPHAQLYISQSGSHDWLITNPDEFANALANGLHPFPSSPTPATLTAQRGISA